MESGGGVRALWVALATYVVVFALKLAVYFATGILVILAEALHTLSDIFITSLLLAAALWSSRRADATYMFGYGRAQNIAALIAATLFISFTSYRLFEESIPRFFGDEPAGFENVELAVGVVVASMAIGLVPLVMLVRERRKGPAARAQLVETFNDMLGLVAALAGTLLAVNVNGYFDPAASAVVATIIAFNALGLLRENAGLLLGRAPSPAYLAQIEASARSVAGVLGIRDVRAEYVGPDIVHAGMTIEVSPELPVKEASRIAEEVRQRIHDGARPGFCVVAVEPAGPASGMAIPDGRDTR